MSQNGRKKGSSSSKGKKDQMNFATGDWISRTVGQLFTDVSRVSSGEPPKATEFNHVELEEIDVNLFRAKKEALW